MKQTTTYTEVGFVKEIVGILPKSVELVYDKCVLLQPWPLAIKRLLNKPYENEVTLTRQKPPLKCCQLLELLTQLKRGIDL